MTDNPIDLNLLPEEEFLKLRICDLPLAIEGTWLEECVAKLYEELDLNGIRFKPLCYLSDEWLTPDGEPVVGIPFYLAHPALIKMEKQMMLDAEGGTKPWCMKLLRHETGHAINYAYKLHRRKKWQSLFGEFNKEYTDTYRFRPYSKNFVHHLEDYYAQYHPDEDFAETFAVWLTPESDWHSRYKGWNALKKLHYVQELMDEIKDKEPIVGAGKKYWQASRLTSTLENYYKKKRHLYAEELHGFHDMNLARIFSEKKADDNSVCFAHAMISRYRKNIIATVSTWTGEKKYVIDGLLKILIKRCRQLQLALTEPEPQAVLRITAYVTVLVMNYMYTGRLRGKK